jgi:hypothetical protein
VATVSDQTIRWDLLKCEMRIIQCLQTPGWTPFSKQPPNTNAAVDTVPSSQPRCAMGILAAKIADDDWPR